ncbi:MAG: DnaD domain protein [Clostridia bacterium]|nr:DnaD domain protein [Clostridia bacterium]
MKKNEKISLKYKETRLPSSFLDSVRSADENDLRVMLSLALLETEEISPEELCKRLEISESEFDASVKYWCGAGLLKKGKRSATGAESKPKTETKTVADAHRDGKLERASEIPSYSSAELTELIERQRITAEFIDEAQRVFGKMFNTHDINILVGMVDYIGFDEASVILLLDYVKNKGKRSLRYAEKLAFELYDEGVTTVQALQNRFLKMEEYAKTESAVAAMFGMSGRALTAKEKKFLHSWIEDMGYGVECIRLAYDITVDNTHEPLPAYANTILTNWYNDGLRTYDAIVAAEEERRSKGKKGKEQDKSFDTDEFFAAALKRTFEEL